MTALFGDVSAVVAVVVFAFAADKLIEHLFNWKTHPSTNIDWCEQRVCGVAPVRAVRSFNRRDGFFFALMHRAIARFRVKQRKGKKKHV